MFRYVQPLAILLALGSSAAAADWPMLGRSASRNPVTEEKYPPRGQDWSQYGRDGTRNGVSPEKNAPAWWQLEERDDAGKIVKPAKNIRWTARLGSETYGDPVVAGGIIWVGTNNQGTKPAKPKERPPDASVLMAFDAETGRELYRYVSPRSPAGRVQDWPRASMACSPLIEGDRLWFVTNLCEVVCLDLRPLRLRQGEPMLAWKVDMRRDLGVFPRAVHLSGSHLPSVASWQNLVFVGTGNGVDESFENVPAPKAPSLVCFDKNTGKVVWSDNSPGKNILMNQPSSPLVIEVGGQAQVVHAQGDGWVRAFDARTGKPIWQFDTNPKDAKRAFPAFTRNLVPGTPVFAGGRLHIGNGIDLEHGGGPAWLYCLDPTRKGDISYELPAGAAKGKPNPNSGVIWRYGGIDPQTKSPRFQRTLSNVAVHAALVIATDLRGTIHCLDANTGERHWTHEVGSSILGSPLIVDGKVYVGSDDHVWVFALSKKKNLLHQIEMSGHEVRCSPIFAHGTLYIATRHMLYAIAGNDKPPGKLNFGHWPQWRGPERTNIAPDKGLLKTWPAEGPPLLWKAEGLGRGPMSVAVTDGRIFALGYKDENEVLQALDEADGKVLWTSPPLGPAPKSSNVMEWLSQRTPTVDGERVYALGVKGTLVCVHAWSGNEIWRKDYVKDFGGKSGPWGFADYPLVDGDKLICTPGGPTGTVVALDKTTGAVLWQCAVPGKDRANYGALIAAEQAGKRVFIHQLESGVVGIGADGALLWQHPRNKTGSGNVHTALVRGNDLFFSCGWGTGCGLLRLLPEAPANAPPVSEFYYTKLTLDPWLASSVLLGDQVHTSCGKCIDFKTGKLLHDLKLGRATMIAAEGRLYRRTGNNLLLVHEYGPDGYVEKGRFQAPRLGMGPGPTWSFPVIAAGKLYLRDQGWLLCYDLRDKKDAGAAAKPPRQPDAIFVPTPEDVVLKMLELAKVKKSDLVMDLGCGDGRIVVTAAKKYGCRAVGCDLDAECVKLARDLVRKEGVDKLVTIEHQDLFTRDLSGADVVALYLFPKLNVKLLPQLEKLKPGSRIVSHQFAIEGYRPERALRVQSTEDGVEHTIYLWTTPLKKE